jgi:hypothetical protein
MASDFDELDSAELIEVSRVAVWRLFAPRP